MDARMIELSIPSAATATDPAGKEYTSYNIVAKAPEQGT